MCNVLRLLYKIKVEWNQIFGNFLKNLYSATTRQQRKKIWMKFFKVDLLNFSFNMFKKIIQSQISQDIGYYQTGKGHNFKIVFKLMLEETSYTLLGFSFSYYMHKSTNVFVKV